MEGVHHGPVINLEQIDDEAKRMLLMETANALRGQNDPLLEAMRFKAILDEGRADDLVKMLAMSREDFDKRLGLLRVPEGGITAGEARQLMAKDITEGLAAFTVFNGRSGEWQERTREWRKVIPNEWASATREETLFDAGNPLGDIGTVSVFNHTLAEVLIRMFSTVGSNVLVPFMGEPVISMIAAILHRQVYGIELRPEQVAINEAVFKKLELEPGCMTITTGDACNPENYNIIKEWADLVISCPPYMWLEKYSDLPEDLSNMDQAQFWDAFDKALMGCYHAAKEGAFMVLILGNVRQPDGRVVDLSGLTIQLAQGHGWALYNDCIYLQPIGTAGMRMGQFTDTRKLVRVHESVLVFYKGDTKTAGDAAKKLNETVKIGDEA